MFASCTALLVLSIAVASASPTAPTDLARSAGPRGFEVPAIHNANKVRNGTRAPHKAIAKYNLTPTRTMKSLISKRQDGSVTATPAADDAKYLCSVSVGGEDLMLDFDTGSSDFYAGGSGASGTVGTDTVKLGGTIMTKQAVELATTVSSSFVSDTADGLVGLAFSSINTVQPKQQSTFFDNAQANPDSPLFTAYLPSESDGSYEFGIIDDSKYTGTISYADVDDSNRFLEYASTSHKVGSTAHSQSGRTGISDTGTTLILMGDSAVDTYYAQVFGAKFNDDQEGYVFDCTATLPSLFFKVGSSYATVDGAPMNLGAIDNSGETCFESLQSVGSGTQNIYGDCFFNAQFGVFDASRPRFGFAPLA